MLNYSKTSSFFISLSFILSSFLLFAPVNASTSPAVPQKGIKSAFSSEGKLGNFAKDIGYNQEAQSPEYYVGLVINIAFSLLGVIALALLIFNGFKWMTAQGNENQVKEARGGLISSILGLLIILASYAIAFFIFNIFT
ncbi:hypothetical protein EOL72_01225 [Candidatus Falkowbacteria bacterium]|jgi:hypothetical protein|nr:hypothetical protein [Patescibacteria group bacterium]MDD3435260.1 hypothetical protein [Patescibacteria group bacterium]MDD4466248.1 hypothetical protein [Patescibacteria group bacterium]NCU42958.1 hypothetical protein [Candidatus Falkowbacteria bacterium]